ncbi:MAG TPA: class I SAM-dependent methyltransferase [Baekduia sp.]|uniref:class I SAM-dependent methyltransferase n=1 Tax=Baekduia sp. TaxID=2600305 RepID=UPI002D77B885|nr:class I SAM-dependent methyltransferase [Baekduia sp.]HET6508614.1 class I SAM-dependent methyltransferase [Baekduia sp.]
MPADLGDGIPGTALWTLWHRALEARRPGGVLDDPRAIELVEAIDYPFAERFGEVGAFGQWQALRVLRFDEEVRRFAAARPGGTVVALGEGLETSFWRVDDGTLRWVGVDVEEMVAARAALLPDEGGVAVGAGAGGVGDARRRRSVAASAFDVDAWAPSVDPSRGVLVTAQGLLMYFSRSEAHGLLGALAARFPGAALVFDVMPAAAVARSGRPSGTGWQPPPWRWGWDAGEERALRALPGIAGLDHLPLRPGRGFFGGLALPLATRVPGLWRGLPAVLRARFV